ncbi:MAG: bifunctional phosphoribosylaminoimidazolecarboxamide formyltransferase/IMP cyclohydrolase [Thermotogae bacterium]|nr:bifunctional phosphoribosylaminoimidazolecarboxamide formyltransferase/IMP cyclohydrolase [Thermotogota bacterium]
MKSILVSLYRKEEYLDDLRNLAREGWEIWASSGTAKFLKEHGLNVHDVSTITGFENLLGGLVKTLHPEVFAGIMGPEPRWDIVLVDLYPPPDIDIGGVALLRAAAKNWKKVKPAYNRETLMLALKADDEESRRKLAALTFAFTSRYDSVRANQFVTGTSISLSRGIPDLRYGENPHEDAVVYGEPVFEILSEKKQISYNNVLDTEAAWFVVKNLEIPGAVVVKHQSPCGAAVGRKGEEREVVLKALNADAESSYGGILAVNFELDESVVEVLKTYLEVIVAPDYTPGALEMLSKKKTRILKIQKDYEAKTGRFAFGALVVGERKLPDGEMRLKVGTPAPSEKLRDLWLAFKVVEGVKSNAIVLVNNGVTVGIGSGQPSRKRAAWLATVLASEKARDAVAASDAFFPFPDGLEVLAEAGVRYVVAPLGSIRDAEVLSSAERLGITFYEAPGRVFRH